VGGAGAEPLYDMLAFAPMQTLEGITKLAVGIALTFTA
jgi:hypothetical protein